MSNMAAIEIFLLIKDLFYMEASRLQSDIINQVSIKSDREKRHYLESCVKSPPRILHNALGKSQNYNRVLLHDNTVNNQQHHYKPACGMTIFLVLTFPT